MSKRLRQSSQPSTKGLSIRPKGGQGRNSSLSLIPPAPRTSQSSMPPAPERESLAPAQARESAAVVDSSALETRRLPVANEPEPESTNELTSPSAVLAPAPALDWNDTRPQPVEVVASPREEAPSFNDEGPSSEPAMAAPAAPPVEEPKAVPSSAAEPPITRAESPAAIARGEASVEDEDEDEDEAPAAEPEAAKLVVAKAAEPTTLEHTSPSMASPLAAAMIAEPVVEKKAAEPVVEKKAAEPEKKAAEPVVEKKAAEPAVEKKAAEPEKKAVQPAPAAKSDVRADASRSDGKKNKGKNKGKGEPARVEPAKAEQAKAEAKAATQADAAKDDGEDEVKASHKSGVGDDDVDLSTVSAEFFRRDHDSLPPVTEPHPEQDEVAVVQLSPATLARRARLRRIVAGVVSFAGVLSIAVVGKTLAASGKRSSSPVSNKPPVVQEVKPTSVDTSAAVVTAATNALPAPVPSALPSAVPSAEPSAAASAAASASAAPSASASAEPAAPSGGDAVALRKETESLLNRGKTKEAIGKAREAIAADPTDANAYLYLGSALQDTGKWKEGIEAYSECVRNATKGPVHECRAMGGRK
ncbi:MAG: hypothetical protein U0359_36970 [Byssovorax sp.]